MVARAVTFLFVTAFAMVISSKEINYSGHQIWSVIPESMKALEIIREIGDNFQLDFWKHPNAIGHHVDFRVEPAHAKNLRKALEYKGFEIIVNVKDVQSLIDAEKSYSKPEGRAPAGSVASFDYSRYHPAEEIYDWMDLVIAEHTFATKEQIGVTYEGRPMYVLKFQKRPSVNPKPLIFVDSLIHCREWVATASLLFIFKEMLRNPKYTHMIDDADWYFVPMINVDGYIKTWTEDRLWRKTTSQGPSSLCEGIDANRNWDAHWSEPGSSFEPCSIIFHGPTVFSESETRHLAKYVTNLGQGSIDAYITTHSFSQVILYAYHYTAVPSKDDEVLESTGKLMHDAMKSVHGKSYIYGTGSTVIFTSSGTTTDWTYEKAGIVRSHTFELRDTGEYGFILPPDQIIPTGEEYIAGLEALSNYLKDNMAMATS